MNPTNVLPGNDGLPTPVTDTTAAPSVPNTSVNPVTSDFVVDNNPSPTTGAHSTLSPHIADDADLIEKEWVNIAKSIVANTKDNPSEQSKEINKFKADYLKKRYNKDIKVSES